MRSGGPARRISVNGRQKACFPTGMEVKEVRIGRVEKFRGLVGTAGNGGREMGMHSRRAGFME